MKRYILTKGFFLVFIVNVFSQNTATINQSGYYQAGIQNQTGNSQLSAINQNQGTGGVTNQGNWGATYQTGTNSNTATVNQNGGAQGNRAGITQSGGDGNNATVSQNGGALGLSGGNVVAPAQASLTGAAGDGNFAGILQLGNANVGVSIMQNNLSQKNRAEIWQNGFNNSNTTIQQSNNSVGNKAEVLQGYTTREVRGTASFQNRATVQQNGNTVIGTTNESRDNEAQITQLGTSNYVAIQQNAPSSNISTNNRALIAQNGGYHQSYIYQNSSARGASADNLLVVSQIGVAASGHQVIVYQYQNSLRNEITIRQSDLGHQANITQIGDIGQTSEANKTVLSQSGSYNWATITQGSFGLSNDGAANNKIVVNQSGTLNSVIIGQGGIQSTSKAVVTQSGSDNEAKVWQTQGSNNESYIDQLTTGEHNSASNSQNGISNINATTQRGSYNQASTRVIGNNNTTTITQTGDWNEVAGLNGSPLGFNGDAKLYGNTNTLSIKQQGASGSWQLYRGEIVGNNNIVTVTQTN